MTGKQQTPSAEAMRVAEEIADYRNDQVFTDNGTTLVDYEALCNQIAAALEKYHAEQRANEPLTNCYCAVPNTYVAELCKGCHSRVGYEWEDDTIKGLQDKARAEGYRQGVEECAKTHHDKHLHDEICIPCYKKGEVKGIEDAAEIAEFSHVPPCCGPTISKDIRALAEKK